MLRDLFTSIKQRRQGRNNARLADAQELAVLIGESELGNPKIEVDVDHFAAALEYEDLTETDLRDNIERYKTRVRKAKLAARINELKDAAVKAEEALRDEDLAEGQRRREAAVRLERLEAEMRHAIQLAGEAEAARSDLIAGAAVSGEERALSDELASINRQIAKIGVLVDPTPRLNGDTEPGSFVSSIHEAPARLARQMRQALEKDYDKKGGRVGYSAERRKELERTLAAAEKAVAEHRATLTKLEKQRAAIQAKLTKLAAAKLKPENFPFVRTAPCRDDAAKRRAFEFGLHAGTGVATSS
jgi:hypothetical protein